MDWYSFVFMVLCGTVAVYTASGVIWALVMLFSSDRLMVQWIKLQWNGLLLSWIIAASSATLMFGLHALGVITMWEVGFALQRGL